MRDWARLGNAKEKRKEEAELTEGKEKAEGAHGEAEDGRDGTLLEER